MGFSNEQVEALKAPLNRANVKERTQAGRSLSYVEGWHAIAEANRIFGFDGWDRETVDLRECGEPRQVDGKWRVAFICRVRIRVHTQLIDADVVIRDGTGYGSGIDQDLGQAYESAVKESETDAMKRGLMTFGNPFGLALYDKAQANVADVQEAPQAPSSAETAEDLISALTKRAGGAVDRFLGRQEVKEAIATLTPDDNRRVETVAMARREVAPVERAA